MTDIPQARVTRRRTVVKVVFYVAIAVAFAWFLWSVDWASLRGLQVTAWLLVPAAVLGWGFRYYGVFVWRTVLTLMGAQSLPRFAVLADIYAKAWLARYIPGTVPWIAGKIYLAAQHGLSKSTLAVSSIVEAATQVVGVAAVSLALLASDSRIAEVSPALRVVAFAGAAACVVAVAPPVFNRLTSWGMTVMRRGTQVNVTWRGVAEPTALYAMGAFLSGLSYVVFSQALVDTVTWSDTAFIVGAFGLAGVIGMLTPLVPSGLGTRDATLLVLLLVIMTPAQAAVVVLASRVWSALVDVVFWAGALAAR